MADYLARISHPALTNHSIDWGGARDGEVFPRRVPDLFVGRPVILAGRFAGAPPTSLRVRGTVRGETQEIDVPAIPSDLGTDVPGTGAIRPHVAAARPVPRHH
jgi:Ca-activated chloride channel family protein